MGAGIIWTMAQYVRRRGRLTRNGKRAKAYVTDIKEKVTKTASDEKRTVYEHTVEYTVVGAPFSNRLSDESSHEIGSEYDIVYNPDNPKLLKSSSAPALISGSILIFL